METLLIKIERLAYRNNCSKIVISQNHICCTLKRPTIKIMRKMKIELTLVNQAGIPSLGVLCTSSEILKN